MQASREADGEGGGKFSVELRGITREFGGVVVVDNINLNIRRHEFFSLLGPSGCGKTTTLKIIGGFHEPTSGDVWINGRQETHLPPYKRAVNTVFQNYALFPHMSVAENVAFGLKMKHVERVEAARRVDEMLGLVSLDGLGGRRPSQLSGGQQQRVALARALVNHPSVLLLDEPLGALDLKLRKQMQLELSRIQRAVGTTFIYVTHDQEEALAMSDRIAVMNGGVIEQIDTPEGLYERPRTAFVADFIGTSNFFSGRAGEGGVRGEKRLVPVLFPEVGAIWCVTHEPVEPGALVTVAVRPEKMEVSAAAPADAGNSLQGTLSKVVYLGSTTHLHVTLKSGQQVVSFRQNSQSALELPAEGSAVHVSWSEDAGRIVATDSR